MRVSSKPPRNSTWLNYHEEMTAKYRYFVREMGLAPFYTNESLSDLKSLLSGSIRHIGVINCEWSKDIWNEVPYKYRFINNGNKYVWYAHPSTEKPNHYTFKPTALFINGKWSELHYQDSVGEHSTSFFLDSSGFCLINHAGQLLERSKSGIWRYIVGLESIKLDDPPIDNLIPQARRINAKKWRGFYRPIIDFLISEGLDESYL